MAAALRERRVQGLEAVEKAPYVPDAVEAVETPPLEACLEGYWTVGSEVGDVALSVAYPKVDMALLKRLGMPNYVNEQSFRAQMERVYDGVADRALEVAFADT